MGRFPLSAAVLLPGSLAVSEKTVFSLGTVVMIVGSAAAAWAIR